MRVGSCWARPRWAVYHSAAPRRLGLWHGKPESRPLAAVRRLVAAYLPDDGVDSVVSVGEGTDHLAFEVDGELIVRWTKEPDAAPRGRTGGA